MMETFTTQQLKQFGRKHWTSTGWKDHSATYYGSDILSRDFYSTNNSSSRTNCSSDSQVVNSNINSSAENNNNDNSNISKPHGLLHQDNVRERKVFLLTGATAGVGREIYSFLAAQNAIIYIICENLEDGEHIRDGLQLSTKNFDLQVIKANLGVKADVIQAFNNFLELERRRLGAESEIQLHGVVFNAETMQESRKLTREGVETTLATNLLFGVYLLGELAIPCLETTPNSRLIVVSSWEMYKSKFPDWSIASSTSNSHFHGKHVYNYTKRGQVLLCERWAESRTKTKIVSCHPGWVDTARDSDKTKADCRSFWEGAEGILWLCLANAEDIKSGEFYLDRKPQPKHIFSKSFFRAMGTKNSRKEIDAMMVNLAEWSRGERPTENQTQERLALQRPLQALSSHHLNLSRIVGTWYVLASIPSIFEVGTSNCMETYSMETSSNVIMTEFSYISPGSSSRKTYLKRNTIVNQPFNTHWKVMPKSFCFIPICLDYVVIDLARDYSYFTIGVPNRSMLWIMIRERPTISEYNKSRVGPNNTERRNAIASQEYILEKAIDTAVRKGYDHSKIVRASWNYDLEI